MLSEATQKELALATKALVKENEKLTLIKDAILVKIEQLHKYNVIMKHKVPITELQEDMLRRIMSIPGAIPEVNQ